MSQETKVSKQEFVKETNGKVTRIDTTTETDYNIDGEIAALKAEKSSCQQIIIDIDTRLAVLEAVKTKHI